MAIWVSELPKAETEEGGILGRKLEPDVTIDHRNRFRGHSEGGEGHEIGGLEKVDLHLYVPLIIHSDSRICRHGVDLIFGEAGVSLCKRCITLCKRCITLCNRCITLCCHLCKLHLK